MIRAGKEFPSSKTLPILLILISFTAAGSSAEVKASTSQIDWKQPFSPESTNMPEHFSSGSTLNFEVEVSDSVHDNADDIDFFQKTADSQTYSELESQNIQVQWKHAKTAAGDTISQYTYFGDKKTNEVSLSEGETTAVLIGGQEVTIEVVSIDGTTAGDTSQPTFVEANIGGKSYDLYPGQYAAGPDNCYIRLEEVPGNAIFQEYCSDRSPSDNNYEYKAVVTKNNGDRLHSDKLFLDISGFNNANRPYIENVTVNGQSINHFGSLSGINPGATVKADVIEREGDAYKVTLEDRTGTSDVEVQRISVNDDGTLEDIYSVVLDFTFDPFFDTGGLKGDNSNRVAFKILPEERDNAIDLFGISGTYDFGFTVEDYGNDATSDGVRKTTDFTLTTDGTVYQPNITSVDGSADCSSYSSLSSFDSKQALNCIRVTATDENDDDLFVAMNLTEVYDGIDRNTYSTVANNYHQKNGDKYIFNLSKIDIPTDEVNASGEWKAEFIASDGLSNDTRTVSWSVPWGQLMVERVQPSSTPFSVLSNESFSNSYRISCSGGPECVNQNESVTLKWDPKPMDKLLGGLT